MKQCKEWEIIHEMDNEDGTPTCYTKKFGNQLWWATKYPKRWIAETKVKTDGDSPELIQVKEFKTERACINWIENNHQNWTEQEAQK